MVESDSFILFRLWPNFFHNETGFTTFGDLFQVCVYRELLCGLYCSKRTCSMITSFVALMMFLLKEKNVAH